MIKSSIIMQIAEKVATIKQCSLKLIILLIINDSNNEITKTMPPCNQFTFLQLLTGVRRSVHYKVLPASISLGLKVNSTGST